MDWVAVSMPQLTTSGSNRQGRGQGLSESLVPTGRTLDRSTARNEVDQEHDQRDHQQHVNQAAGNVEHSPSEKPGDQQDDCEPYQHGNPSAKVITPWAT